MHALDACERSTHEPGCGRALPHRGPATGATRFEFRSPRAARGSVSSALLDPRAPRAAHRTIPRMIPMGSKLYVGNLNFTTTEDSLRTAFSQNGRSVKEVAIPSDRETGRPRGF